MLRRYFRLGCCSIVVFEHSPKTLLTLDRSTVCEVVRIRLNQAVAEALVVALAVVMRHEVLNRCAQRTLAKQDQPFQARFFYAPNELLGVRIGLSIQLHPIGIACASASG